MWPDDIHWIPLFLEGKRFKGRFLFGESDSILDQELIEVKELYSEEMAIMPQAN